ncbi:DUF2804 family protein [Microbacterium gorillae]|uniref:DUF2804 family protein n=1 Tax=Microbacterium gorillae TaxID=1231063 RepID=UPI001E32ABE7|nr:DUF2804 family protein [Microbacterium gorillae]
MPLAEYPRPQRVRAGGIILNGLWDIAFTPLHGADAVTVADPTSPPASFGGTILVPFSPETALSGVGRALQPDETLWYRRRFVVPTRRDGDRVLLHFGAVDQCCRVAVDGTEVGGHVGGYLPFTLDITAALTDGGDHEIVVAVRDVSDTSWHSRGKQKTDRGGIWYTPQSGIWQTVWCEVVPAVAVDDLVITPLLATGEIEITVLSDGAAPDARAGVELVADGSSLLEAAVPVGEPTRIRVPGPVRPWSPEDPQLYDLVITLDTDEVTSYVGMRSFGVGEDSAGRPCLLLNGEPYLPVGLLDQGYWPDGGYTAPSDEALRYDIELAKSMGFTMLRKHIKVEPLRWYHHCDRLGMLVWQDHVSGGTAYKDVIVTAPAIWSPRVNDSRHALFGRADAAGRAQSETELSEMIEHLRSVPSLALWVPFNEAWGQFDAARIAADVAALDSTRQVDHASGWHDQGAGDLFSKHVYFQKVRVTPAWREDGRVIALTEYGGYGNVVSGHTFPKTFKPYRMFESADDLVTAFERLHTDEIVPAIRDGLAAVVYTQLSDVEDEVNGMVTYDRRVVKLPVPRVRAVTDALRAAFNAPSTASSAASSVTTGVPERELTSPVSLTGPEGTFNPDAHGWARQPIVDTAGIDGRKTWGRNKRWEYWCVMTPTHILACTVSSIDFAAVHEVWVHDRASGTSVGRGATGIGPWSATLPANAEGGPARARHGDLSIDIEEVPGGTRLRASIPGASFDVVAERPEGHERLAVVVPWSRTRFQYTVKDLARPASGTVTVHGLTSPVPAGESWAVLDHGRGRWPHDITWNWGAGSGRLADGRALGIQVGGQWTDGTGSTENAVLVGTRLHKISETLNWEYDISRPMEQWRITGGGLDVTFTPFFDKTSSTNLGVISARTDQCFGRYSGTFRTDEVDISFTDIEGWAEDVHNRW